MEAETLPGLVYDKLSWGDGPWQHEPDRADWVWAGFACFALRHDRGGHWCGYVGVPAGHPAYGVDPLADGLATVPFHGDLNYGAKCQGYICHVPRPGMPADVWWLGGDFGHTCDLAPGYRARELQLDRRLGLPRLALPAFMREVYRPLPYVVKVVNRAAEALRVIAESGSLAGPSSAGA